MKLGTLLGTLALAITLNVSASEVISLPFTQVDTSEELISESSDKAGHTISKVTIEEIDSGRDYLSFDKEEGSLGQAIMVVDKLIAFGTKIYKLVEKGKPVVNTSFNKFSVLPNTDDPRFTFARMANWSAPSYKTYKITYENLYGMDVVEFEFTVSYQYNGTLEGNGKYLTNVLVTPGRVDVAWLYKFEAGTELQAVTNRGSLESPMAAGTFTVSHQVNTIVKHSHSSVSFHVDGQGDLRVLR